MWLGISATIIYALSALSIVIGIVLQLAHKETKLAGAFLTKHGAIGMLVFLAFIIATMISVQLSKLALPTPVQVLLDIATVLLCLLAVFLSPTGWILKSRNGTSE
ncbi:hypothetical protein Poly41_22460 [Novipirellula artificiosorum]|uniref:Uncharacterized protein n=2 Tax=Novipirellula artificiosorum TaxID=2528016 RepID=A0A5C6DRX7_9BACT|nr:hypothetical protein Poly41_22460 [Novipirellula artificiosorum]